MLIELYSNKTASTPQPCTFLFTATGEGLSYRFLMRFYNTDVPESLYDRIGDCCNKDVSLSCNLWLYRHVRHSLLLYPQRH